MKHGFTANPATGTIEDGGEFERMLEALRNELQPRTTVEELIVHRIAVSGWRLQRCAQADAAVWDTAIHGIQPAGREVQEYVEQILDCWRAERINDPDSVLQLKRKAAKHPPARLSVRNRLGDLDRLRSERLLQDGSAILAMLRLMEDLMDRLQHAPRTFNCFHAEQLAWTLGESAGRLVEHEDAAQFPGLFPGAREADRLILEAAKRDPAEPVPDALSRLVERRETVLRVQSQTCARPYADKTLEQQQRQAAFTGESVLDRLLRYETHAERSLHRNLEQLAGIRGLTVDTIATRVLRRVNGDTEVDVQGQRAFWHGL